MENATDLSPIFGDFSLKVAHQCPTEHRPDVDLPAYVLIIAPNRKKSLLAVAKRQKRQLHLQSGEQGSERKRSSKLQNQKDKTELPGSDALCDRTARATGASTEFELNFTPTHEPKGAFGSAQRGCC